MRGRHRSRRCGGGRFPVDRCAADRAFVSQRVDSTLLAGSKRSLTYRRCLPAPCSQVRVRTCCRVAIASARSLRLPPVWSPPYQCVWLETPDTNRGKTSRACAGGWRRCSTPPWKRRRACAREASPASPAYTVRRRPPRGSASAASDGERVANGHPTTGDATRRAVALDAEARRGVHDVFSTTMNACDGCARPCVLSTWAPRPADGRGSWHGAAFESSPSTMARSRVPWRRPAGRTRPRRRAHLPPAARGRLDGVRHLAAAVAHRRAGRLMGRRRRLSQDDLQSQAADEKTLRRGSPLRIDDPRRAGAATDALYAYASGSFTTTAKRSLATAHASD